MTKGVKKPKKKPIEDIILHVQGLSLFLHRNGKVIEILSKIEFKLKEGEIIGIVGESGCGKSLLAKTLISLFPTGMTIKGEIWFTTPQGNVINLLNISSDKLDTIRGKNIGILFQEPLASMNPVMTCGKQVLDALPEEQKNSRRMGLNQVVNLFELVGLNVPEQIMKMYPHELSGGMIQRVALAAALAGNPQILIADEPTTALDAHSRNQLLQTLVSLKKELGLSLLLISHDINIIQEWVDRTMIMYAGRMAEMGETQKVLSVPNHPYTQSLVHTAHSYREGRRPIPIAGEPPSFAALPNGCKFHPRCQRKQDLCQMEDPTPQKATHRGVVYCFYPYN